ncbi:unnamed protein product [Ilex paraguariensis]|uniref:Uncharacterized protein n=1 Tax=Ilex paraguariensis TaxID=185542 RepID=A0ABC8TWZ4_9AQUA
MADALPSFWGPVTANTEWCEQNYVYSSYIAEFYNTISNISFILLALIGFVNALRQRFEKRFSVLHISNMILAIGSMMYHATLQQGAGSMLRSDGKAGDSRLFVVEVLDWCRGTSSFPWKGIWSANVPPRWFFQSLGVLGLGNDFEIIFRQQQFDETPMVWEMLLYLYILYSPDWHYRSTMPTFLFLYGAVFAVAHSQVRFDIGFKLHYTLLCLLCIPRMYKYYIHTEDRSAKRLAKLYLITLLLGSLCWLCDRLFCKNISTWYFNPQGHALWHVLMGFNSYFANTFMMFCRALQRGWDPKVKHSMGFFPYVKIQKPKIQ